ncbi:MAG: HEAT repeat domain-containing protein [Planctomycetes bacterium]|nr:HEAT repeat domain-containing protein [Planctomycetota bacterium]
MGLFVQISILAAISICGCTAKPAAPDSQPAASTRLAAIPATQLATLTTTGPSLSKEDATRQKEKAIWEVYRKAMLDFQDGRMSRWDFLETCKKLLADHPDSGYQAQWGDFISAIEREFAAGEPVFVKKSVEERTKQEEIAYWVYKIHDLDCRQYWDPGYPMIFAMDSAKPNPADHLVAIGPAAIPQLIDALTDNTPTRTIGWYRHWSSYYYILRRQDIALHCLERIVGFEFYEEPGTASYFHTEKPGNQASVLENVREWWKQSEGKSQAQMVRNQLVLRTKNLTLQSYYDEIHTLETLAMLEGPQAVVERALQLLAEDHYGLNSPTVEVLEKIDPQSVVRGVMQRFWANQSKGGDYETLLRYGDRKVYQEIARRFEQTGRMDPTSWCLDEQVQWAVKFGKNWAIPILARMLQEIEMSATRSSSDGKYRVPDYAVHEEMETLAKLTEKDFGYRRDADAESRKAAIIKARQWWESTGRDELKEKIAAGHPPVADVGDLFATDAQIDERVKAIAGSDAAARLKAFGELGTVYSWRVQTALVAALAKTSDTQERLSILRILQKRPSLWMFPTFADLFKDAKADITVRMLAGQIIRDVVADHGTSIWRRRLETRDAALTAARQVLLTYDHTQPAEINNQAAAILYAWRWWVDLHLLESLKILQAIPSTSSAPASQPATSSADTSWSQAVNGLRGRVVLTRKSVMNGTTIIYAHLELLNITNESIKLAWSSERMKFRMVDSQGKDTPRPQSIIYSGRIGRKKDVVIPPGETVGLDMSTGGMGIGADMSGLIDLGPDNCWEFKSSDTNFYFKAVLEVPEDKAVNADKGKVWHGRIELPPALVPLKPSAIDPAKAEELIRQLGAKMIEAPYTDAGEEAADALSLIDDERVIPWYVKAMDTDSSQLRMHALDRLSRFKGDAALEGIRKGMKTQRPDIGNCTTPQVAYQAAEAVRYSTAIALARSPHPKARELLLTMRHDPHSWVRTAIVQAFGEMDTKEALELLEKMSQDPDEGVRGEAKRYLELHKKKLATQPSSVPATRP